MRKKYRITLVIIAIFLILSIYTGISYSLYDNGNNNQDLSLIETNETISVNYLNGKEYNIKSMMPNDTITKKVSITNVSDNTTFVSISLMDVEKSSDGLVLKVLDGDSNAIYNEKITDIDTEVIRSVELGVGKTVSYTLIITNDSENTIDEFNANILTYSESLQTSSLNFKDTILANNTIGNLSRTGLGKDIAKEDEGLIKTKDDIGEAYYFRGNVLNNYVNFGGYTFRILRINGDGTIRLILNDALEEIAAYNSNIDEVDDYTTKLLLEEATINEKLNSWVNTNLEEYSRYIVPTNFCSETAVNNEENNTSYLISYNRLIVDDNPTLACLGKVINAKVGLITADEVVFAGAYHDRINTNYFLYNSAIKNGWWTMTGSKIISSNNSASVFVVMPNGGLNSDKKVSMEFAVRPVLSIDKNATVTGTGTQDDPYTIKK